MQGRGRGLAAAEVLHGVVRGPGVGQGVGVVEGRHAAEVTE